ncbi:6-phosphogluconolactonase [Pseudomonas duriflava]|uniref:6-phosphogluconolactonase n=1 Tax=Pseudomonas duriflava TaxID=459528 RepID=A0A562Q7T9_9PSED|nr:6-phosphogluconolactonase [Pseudomonas duriflava]TWI52799.1 6-phosphogluconolactonase [Pseudomonas duriflava]
MAISNLPQGVEFICVDNREAHAEALTAAVVEALCHAIEQKGEATLVVSGGRSPIPFFERLSVQELDWSKVTISLADERWVPLEHPDSNGGLIRKHLLCNAAKAATLVDLYTSSESVEAAARQANEVLQQNLPKPIDVLVLGMGDDAHTASLFPGSPGLEDALDPASEQLCLPMWAPSVPRQRLTMTRALLSGAHYQFLAIQGESKLAALQTAATVGDELATPIRAFLRKPLKIYWCS